MCSVLGVDNTNFCYRVCSVCERTLPDDPSSLCKFCNYNINNSVSSSKRLFRLLVSILLLGEIIKWFFVKAMMGFWFPWFWQISIATDTKVKVVICFDRAARVLFGCSADHFFDFAKLHPFAGNFILKYLFIYIFSSYSYSKLIAIMLRITIYSVLFILGMNNNLLFYLLFLLLIKIS